MMSMEMRNLIKWVTTQGLGRNSKTAKFTFI